MPRRRPDDSPVAFPPLPTLRWLVRGTDQSIPPPVWGDAPLGVFVMTPTRLIPLIAGILAVALTATADSGPSLSSLDKRERAHYKNLDKRLRILTQLYLSGLTFRVETANMTATHYNDGSASYEGVVDCPNQYIAVGGGNDWGFGASYLDWVVGYSHPSSGGGAWEAGAFASHDSAKAITPRVYAVCLRR